MQLEIDVLKRNLLKLKEKFAYDFGIEIGDNSLQEIVPPSKNFDIYVEEYGKKDIELLEFQKRKIEENIKYLNYDNTMPDITLGVEHSNKYDENRVVLKFSKKLFDLNIDLENEKDNLLQQEINLQQKINEREGEKLTILNNYENYLKEYEVNKNNSELELSKYNIKKLEYSLGKVDYVEVMEYFNSYINYEVAKEKAKNNLNGYIYEIMIRGEK